MEQDHVQVLLRNNPGIVDPHKFADMIISWGQYGNICLYFFEVKKTIYGLKIGINSVPEVYYMKYSEPQDRQRIFEGINDDMGNG